MLRGLVRFVARISGRRGPDVREVVRAVRVAFVNVTRHRNDVALCGGSRGGRRRGFTLCLRELRCEGWGNVEWGWVALHDLVVSAKQHRWFAHGDDHRRIRLSTRFELVLFVQDRSRTRVDREKGSENRQGQEDATEHVEGESSRVFAKRKCARSSASQSKVLIQ